MKKFVIAQKSSVAEFCAIITDLEDTFNSLVNMQIPNREFTENDIKAFCKSLIEGQRGEIKGSGGSIKSGSWGVAPVTDEMTGEERVDFIFKPTYIVISILTFIAKKYPAQVVLVPAQDEYELYDIDTPDDLIRLSRYLR